MQIEVDIKGRQFNYYKFKYHMIGFKTRPAFGDFLKNKYFHTFLNIV